MHELDVSDSHIRNPSLISYVHSHTDSHYYFNNLDFYADSDKSLECFEENPEDHLVTLNRTQMQVEDFWSEAFRKLPNPVDQETENYIQKLETENQRLRDSSSKTVKNKLIMNKNSKLEQERKNFEEKLSELDFLVSSYKTKHTQISVLEENLRVKESLLDQKEKQLRKEKEDLEKSKKIWEQNVLDNNFQTLNSKKNNLKVLVGEEAPPPLAKTPNRFSELEIYQQDLKGLETRFKVTEDSEEKYKLVTVIDQLKNKIAAVRGQQAMMESNRSSKILTHVRKAIEKEVSYEENLRKSNLEKFSIKAAPKISMTPSFNSAGGRRFLFNDE